MGVPNPDDALPSYDDVLREEEQQRLNAAPPPAAPRPEPQHHTRPPAPRPPAPNTGSNRPHSSFHIQGNQKPPLPWVYPSNYHCKKCNNTGYKIKNGRSCKSCWRRFAPVNNVQSNMPFNITTTNNPYNYSSTPSPFMGGGGTPWSYGGANQRPLMVQPGDPRLGGVVCGECRGSGRVRFFLDDDICPLCNGLGRIVGHS
ncbi:hypothetical protein NCAS_0E04040 [Naumovozyma castellii]|uniref:Uncharacterized protein n=1 Tax=Naumovozyma castellii TaxID=27288 RepID=G0VG54_NAUCA|nr:hypothetical protein NCAS_0E04040 [Naumovozyma castellii CBS 4309]CCC70474.1 hypothetical protein NCAS_0E04040 [Naumovozyma castellii CBS 4309]